MISFPKYWHFRQSENRWWRREQKMWIPSVVWDWIADHNNIFIMQCSTVLKYCSKLETFHIYCILFLILLLLYKKSLLLNLPCCLRTGNWNNTVTCWWWPHNDWWFWFKTNSNNNNSMLFLCCWNVVINNIYLLELRQGCKIEVQKISPLRTLDNNTF